MTSESPFVARCGWCGQGLVRLYRCDECAAVSAICDECERIWRDPSVVHADPHARSDGAHPNCPHCPNGNVTWTRLSSADVREHGLEDLVIGRSR
jgi:hypothetical protein